MTSIATSTPGSELRHPVAIALALSLGAAIALGISRFSYGLLLPPMREDLGWSYFLAGAMNTGNAVGYFAGALMTPFLMQRIGAWRVLMAGSLLAAVFMLVSGWATSTTALMLQRVLAGAASAWVFIAGGVLAARLGSLFPQQRVSHSRVKRHNWCRIWRRILYALPSMRACCGLGNSKPRPAA